MQMHHPSEGTSKRPAAAAVAAAIVSFASMRLLSFLCSPSAS